MENASDITREQVLNFPAKEVRPSVFLRQWNDPTKIDSQADWVTQIHVKDRPGVLARYKQHFSRKLPFELSYRLFQNGRYVSIFDIGVPLFSEEGEFEGYSRTLMTGIPEQLSLLGEPLNLSGYFENSAAGVMIVSREGELLYMNPSLCGMLGYSKEEARQIKLFSLFTHIHHKEDFAVSLSSGLPIFNRHYTLAGKGTITREACFSGNKLNDETLAICIQDITSEKELESKLQESNRLLKLMNSISNSISGNLDLHNLIQTITDGATAVSGAEFGSFYLHQKKDDSNELILYTTSGTPHGGLAKNPVPHSIKGNKQNSKTFNISDISVCNDLSNFGLPSRTKAGSLLSIPVHSVRKELLGKIVLYKRMENGFSERAEMLVTDIAGHAAVAIDNCKLFEEKKVNEHRFRVLAESIPQMVWTARSDGNLDYCNQRWIEYTGLSAKESIGSGWLVVVHRSDLTKGIRKWKNCVDSGKPYECEFRIKEQRTGKFRWHLVRAVPILDNRKKVIKWFGTCTDINDQKKNVEIKDDFMNIASHELKTPLTSLKAYVQLIERNLSTEVNEEVKSYLNKANHHISRVSSLITDLLDVSRIQTGKMQFKMTCFSFSNMITEAIDTVQRGTATHKIIINENANVDFYGDKHRLEQVICNYLTNAIKYSPQGEEVFVNTVAAKNSITIAIKDNGIGIESDKIEKIFDRYYRVNEGTAKFTGLGIGLYISKEIISRHNGKTWAESDGKNGTTFYISLPLL